LEPETKNMKDYFSGQAKLYATFRPEYPTELYEFIFDNLKHKHGAWDCATGNGQVAQYLSHHFEKVYATDISQQQLKSAHKTANILYSVSPAENTSFQKDQFDLITVGQALHWFNHEKFYAEAKRVGKNNSLLAAWGYNICTVNPEVDALFLDFYHNDLGPYWDSARRHVENEYATLSFPFEEIACPGFNIRLEWTLDHFIGYLTTWSSTQKYIQIKQTSPVPLLKEKLKSLWNTDEKKIINFPVFLKLGIIHK